MIKLVQILPLAISVNLGSCMLPQPPPLTARERADVDRRLSQIETEAYLMRDRERRSQAEADDIRNRNAPDTYYRTTYSPSFFW